MPPIRWTERHASSRFLPTLLDAELRSRFLRRRQLVGYNTGLECHCWRVGDGAQGLNPTLGETKNELFAISSRSRRSPRQDLLPGILCRKL
jgi:hypothetical protein